MLKELYPEELPCYQNVTDTFSAVTYAMGIVATGYQMQAVSNGDHWGAIATYVASGLLLALGAVLKKSDTIINDLQEFRLSQIG